MTTRLAVPFLALAAAGGCCAPDRCPTARTGFGLLGPATGAILAGADTPGPALEAAGLRPAPAGWAFADARGRAVPVTWDPTRRELSFSYDVPGRNRCAWSAEAPAWDCTGYH
jgi:hypothetical protein